MWHRWVSEFWCPEDEKVQVSSLLKMRRVQAEKKGMSYFTTSINAYAHLACGEMRSKGIVAAVSFTTQIVRSFLDGTALLGSIGFRILWNSVKRGSMNGARF